MKKFQKKLLKNRRNLYEKLLFKNNKLIIGATHLALSFATFSRSAQGLVWEGPLQKIKNSIQGPVANGNRNYSCSR